MPVYQYLDLSTSHVSEEEMDAITSRFADIDDETPVVIPHDHGAWVNVAHCGAEPMEDQHGPHASWCEECGAFAARFPNVNACLERARALGCLWINFDRDGDTDAELEVHEW